MVAGARPVTDLAALGRSRGQRDQELGEVAGVFSKFRPRVCTYRSEPDSCRLAYGTAPFGPI